MVEGEETRYVGDPCVWSILIGLPTGLAAEAAATTATLAAGLEATTWAALVGDAAWMPCSAAALEGIFCVAAAAAASAWMPVIWVVAAEAGGVAAAALVAGALAAAPALAVSSDWPAVRPTGWPAAVVVMRMRRSVCGRTAVPAMPVDTGTRTRTVSPAGPAGRTAPVRGLTRVAL